MNYEQLIEELREEMLQLVNTKCDALLQMYRSGEMHTDKRDTIRESSLITVSPAELKGKRPLAVQFAPGEWIETPTWRKVAQKILQTCNEQPDIHERFMEMCGKVAGRWRTILGSSRGRKGRAYRSGPKRHHTSSPAVRHQPDGHRDRARSASILPADRGEAYHGT